MGRWWPISEKVRAYYTECSRKAVEAERLREREKREMNVPRLTGYTREHRWGMRQTKDGKWEVYGRMLQLQAICVTELDAKTVLHALLERFEEKTKTKP